MANDSNPTFVSINDLPEIDSLSPDAEIMVNNSATPVAANKIKFSDAIKPVTDNISNIQSSVNSLSEDVAELGLIKISKKTQSEWESLGVKDQNTLYIVIQSTGTDASLYIGDIPIM